MPKPTSEAAAAGALGARKARACDGCMRRRARWHCAADDAFLCQSCDASVHSANPLARRHHRVRLPSASSSSSSPPLDPDDPSWLHGLKRRARTPRAKPKMASLPPPPRAAPAVPDLEADEQEDDHEEEDLLYRVPVFEPMLAELCCDHTATKAKPAFASMPLSPELADFHVSEAELANFAADMENLLTGVGDGFDDLETFLEDEKPQLNAEMADLDFESVAVVPRGLGDGTGIQEPCKDEAADIGRSSKKEMILKLDYEAVIASWSREGSSPPWFHGERPHLDPGDPWPDLSAARRVVSGAAVTAVTGGEREARVSRYREKRRTRLFAKKIRYEVRKLNAEKRPRMKGRFVKRAAFPPPLPPSVPVLAPPGHGRFRF